MTRANLVDVVGVMEELYPPAWAEEWDKVGLVVGDPDATVERILLAVDPVRQVADQAVDLHADLVITHHPLLLRPVSTVRADQPKGRIIHELISHGIALYVAHTNADSPAYGVSEALAFALGLTSVRPLSTHADEPHDKIVTFVPEGSVQLVMDALASAGAGQIGDYDRCAFLTPGTGTFRPGASARPAIGTRGTIEFVPETRLEMVMPSSARETVIRTLLAAHPYEEPAYDVLAIAGLATDRGTGRIGVLPRPVTLRDFADAVAGALPPTRSGIRISGDLDATVQSVAVVGGAGDSMLDLVRRERPDVFITSDLRHHPVSEFRENPDAPAVIDVPHWAAEWTWLPVVADAVRDAFKRRGLMVSTIVSDLCTDPWTHHVAHPAYADNQTLGRPSGRPTTEEESR